MNPRIFSSNQKYEDSRKLTYLKLQSQTAVKHIKNCVTFHLFFSYFCVINIFLIVKKLQFIPNVIKLSIIDYQTLQHLIKSIHMKKKTKAPTCSTGWCKNHIISLKPIVNYLHFKKEQKIRLCPKLHKEKQIYERIIPVINNDKRHYTPFFILEEQIEYYNENEERMIKNHQNKIEQNNSDKSEILQPKPARKKNYCAVCRVDYEDYLDHIDSITHKKNLKSNKFNHYILEIQETFRRRSVPFKSDITILTDQSSEGVLNLARKYIKID